MGRGEYYRNKYGGGGRGGRGRGRDDRGEYGGHGGGDGRGGGGWRGGSGRPQSSAAARPTATWQQLGDLLRDIHNRNYGAYHELECEFKCAEVDELVFTLGFDHIQGDPYASPSRAHVQVEAASAALPPDMFRAKIRNVALCDYLTRKFAAAARSAGVDAKTRTCANEVRVDSRCLTGVVMWQAAIRGTAPRAATFRLTRLDST